MNFNPLLTGHKAAYENSQHCRQRNGRRRHGVQRDAEHDHGKGGKGLTKSGFFRLFSTSRQINALSSRLNLT